MTTEEEIDQAVEECKRLILASEPASEERQALVRRLVELRLRRLELRDGPEPPLPDGVLEVRGHRLQPQRIGQRRVYCHGCARVILVVLHRWYHCLGQYQSHLNLHRWYHCLCQYQSYLHLHRWYHCLGQYRLVMSITYRNFSDRKKLSDRFGNSKFWSLIGQLASIQISDPLLLFTNMLFFMHITFMYIICLLFTIKSL